MEIVKGPTFSIQVKAPPERVYSYVADFGRHPEWSPDDMRIQALTPGPARVGSKFKAEGTLQGKRNPSEVEITDLRPPGRIAFTATDKSGPLYHEFKFMPQDGGTLVERQLSAPRLPFAQQAVRTALMLIFLPLAVRPNFMKALNMMKTNVDGGR
jgi:uncharacterized protein YndB with AHSA1/START domain